MDKLTLKDGSFAEISFLSQKDSVLELNRFINKIIDENGYLMMEQRTSMKEEKEWKKSELLAQKKKRGYLLVARIGGKIAATSTARRERGKGSDNVLLGIAVAKEFRGIHLGEKLLRLNIRLAKEKLKARNIYLSVFGPNRVAKNLYEKIGFKEFARFPKWLRQNGKYVDHIFMKL